jgi:hypothetical protein
MFAFRLKLLFLSVLVLLGLQACGGGGGGGTGASVQPSVVMSISSVSPLTAYPGDSLQVVGAGFNNAQKALIGGVDARFTIQSSTQLSLIVPPDALTGIVEIRSTGAIAQSQDRVTILSAPSFIGLSATSVKSGDSVTISGANLDQVREVRINNFLLIPTLKTATQISFTVPAEARTGSLNLLYGNNLVFVVPQSLTILTPVILRSFSPTQALVGETVVFDGEGLDLIAEVVFGTQSAVPVPQTVNRFTVAVPLGAGSGKLVLVTRDGGRITSDAIFSVIPKIVVTGLQPSAGRAGLTITINGSNLAEVASVSVNQKVMTLMTSSDTSLTFAMPAGGGSVLLIGKRQASVKAGVLTEQPPGVNVSGFSPTSGVVGSLINISGMNLDKVVSATIGSVAANIESRSSDSLVVLVPNGGNGAIVLVGDGSNFVVGNFVLTTGTNKPSVTITRVEVAQTYLQAPGDKYQRLVQGKAALLRVLVAGPEGSPSPVVQLTASAGNVALGSISLGGPSTLSSTPQSADLSQSFTTKLPATWVAQNLTLVIDVDPQKAITNGASYTARPVVGTATNFNIVLVPLSISNGNVEAVVPDLATVTTMLAKVFPLAPSTIKVSQRAVYRLTSVAQVKTDDEWSKALSELDDLRDAEGQKKHYYGLVPSLNFSSGNTGLGYVPNSAANGSFRSGIGLDARQSFYLRTMTHEIGHNLGRNHAPCGGVTDPDLAYPYPNGELGPALIYDNVTELIAVISKRNDVMGYCDGSWFSDYNYSQSQSWLESWLYPFSQPMKIAAESTPSLELLDISGEIDAQGVRFAPVFGSLGQVSQAAGDYQLRLSLSDGSQIIEAFSTVKVADSSSDLQHFKLKVLKPALDIIRMEVIKAGVLLPMSQPKAIVAAQKTGEPGPGLVWQEVGGQLLLTWNDSRYRYLNVSHFGSTVRLLARQLQGGQAQLTLGELPAGGEWQLVLSDGMNTRLIRVKR